MRAAGFLPRGLLAAAIFTGGCSDRGASVLQDPSPDPEPTVSFSDDVQPIFDARCIVCHDSDGPSGLTLLSGASYGELVGVTAAGYTALRIAPGDPENSVLYNKITDSGLYGGIMPAVGPPLTAEQISAIATWIEEGALDN
jgi:mono/diheme cytochrome c family protein